MIAGFILLLIIVGGDRSLHSVALPVPSIEVCQAGGAAFLADEGNAELPAGHRRAAYIPVPVPGKDA